MALLRQVPTFEPLNDEALRILAISSEQKELVEGEVLFRAGEKADCGFVLTSGLLQVVEEEADGTLRLIQELKPPALVGEVSLLLANTRAATIMAAEPSVVLRLSRSTFLRTLEGFPDAALKLREMFAARLEETIGALEKVRARLETEGLGKRR